MNRSELKIGELGDIHLGHPKTSTEHILESIRIAFPDNEETGQLDMILFSGDLFDRNLHYNDANIGHIQAFMASFARMCKRRDIVVRILEGTPSHDWGQPSHFAEINEQHSIGADLKYVSTLSIEYIERFGINILYIPDEWKPDPDDIWKDVQTVLREHQLIEVDYVLMHGSFQYQLPPIATIPFHIPDRYLSITKKYIFVGHIHLMSKYERILAAGSLDRLSHGEEGPKGHWRVTVRSNGKDDLVFIENKNAKLYLTIDCKGLPLDEALAKISNFANAQAGSHFRIQAQRGDAIFAGLDVVKTRYPEHRWTTQAADLDSGVQKNLLVDSRKNFSQIHIGPSNIQALLMERVGKMTHNPLVLAQCERALEEILA